MAKWNLLHVGSIGDAQQLERELFYYQIKVSELGYNANTKLPYYVRVCPYCIWEDSTYTFHFRYYLYGR